MNEREQVVIYLHEIADTIRRTPEKLPYPAAAPFLIGALEAAALQIEKGAHLLGPAEVFARELMEVCQAMLEVGVPGAETAGMQDVAMRLFTAAQFDAATAATLLAQARDILAKHKA